MANVSRVKGRLKLIITGGISTTTGREREAQRPVLFIIKERRSFGVLKNKQPPKQVRSCAV
jgi:hypothetical protein